MKLPSLDLDAVNAASLSATNRRLTRLVLETLGGSLARFHTQPKRVALLIDKAGHLVSQDGYTGGREYSSVVLSHFLAGLGWWNDPATESVWSITQAPGLTQNEQLELLTVQVIAHRSQLERQLVPMHDITLGMLRWPDEAFDDDRLWRSLAQLMALRGIPDEAQRTCYCLYESDACKRYALHPINHVVLNEYQTRGYHYYGRRIPRPSDDLQKLPLLTRSRVLLHILLALAFGRHFYLNPLFTPWVNLLEDRDCPRERRQVMARELEAHQLALKEPSPHD